METQELIFNQIKQNLPPNISMVDEIADLLEISNDSAYRRIRGEKALSIDELQVLSRHFGLSLDMLFNLKSGNIVFSNVYVGPDGLTIKEWLNAILNNMIQIHAAKEKEIIYSAKDPPLFHYFQIPEVAAFKTFFWQKTLLQYPEFEEKRFSLIEMDDEIQELGEKALIKYIKVPTIEIWNEDTFLNTFGQIQYYWISGQFERKEDIFALCDAIYKWLMHIQKQTELGFKYFYGQEPIGIEDSFKLYLNEVVLNDNSILVRMDSTTMTYLTYDVLSLAITTNPGFCASKEIFLKKLISHVNEKDRARFFNRLLKRIDDFRNSID